MSENNLFLMYIMKHCTLDIVSLWVENVINSETSHILQMIEIYQLLMRYAAYFSYADTWFSKHM